jgi:hypothetical protein
VLAEPQRRFFFVIAESVLANRVCGPADMLAQLERLREVARQPNVDLRVIGQDAQWPIAPYHGFVLMDDRCVLVDLFNTSLMSRGRRIVRRRSPSAGKCRAAAVVCGPEGSYSALRKDGFDGARRHSERDQKQRVPGRHHPGRGLRIRPRRARGLRAVRRRSRIVDHRR